MTTSPSSPIDDLSAVRSLLGDANPVPDPTLPRDQVLAARADVGMARAVPPPPRAPRGRFVAAGAVAVLSAATLVAIVAMPTGRGTETTTLATGPGGKAVSAAFASTQASGTARGLLTVTQGGRTITATGVGDFTTGTARAEIALGEGAPGGTVSIVRTEAGVYARLPAGLPTVAAGKPWVSVDAATLAGLTQMALGDLGAQITGAPLDALTYLRAVSGDVQVVGPDTTRGEPTTRYRGTIDPGKVADQLPAALQPKAGTAAAELGRPLPTELWIDGQGRLRKLVVTADPAAAATVELWDFGVPVDVVAPPADQVADIGGLLGTLLQNRQGP